MVLTIFLKNSKPRNFTSSVLSLSVPQSSAFVAISGFGYNPSVSTRFIKMCNNSFIAGDPEKILGILGNGGWDARWMVCQGTTA